MNKKQTIKLTEQDLHRIVKESINKVLTEISDTFAQGYINGRRQQVMGNRPMSKAMVNKSERDLARDKAMGYPCGGAKNGEEYARMNANYKASQMYADGRGKYSWGA